MSMITRFDAFSLALLAEGAASATDVVDSVLLARLKMEHTLTVALLHEDVYAEQSARGSFDESVLVGGIEAVRVGGSEDYYVSIVGAARGYGPLLYRLMMEAISQQGEHGALRPDASGSTSPAAAVVWQKFAAGGSPGVVHLGGSGYGYFRPTSVETDALRQLDPAAYTSELTAFLKDGAYDDWDYAAPSQMQKRHVAIHTA